ncbi:MAG: hypothetical protein ACI836_001515 [Saprospiraceae bacterium]|jgi:hypothetical protein
MYFEVLYVLEENERPFSNSEMRPISKRVNGCIKIDLSYTLNPQYIFSLKVIKRKT